MPKILLNLIDFFPGVFRPYDLAFCPFLPFKVNFVILIGPDFHLLPDVNLILAIRPMECIKK